MLFRCTIALITAMLLDTSVAQTILSTAEYASLKEHNDLPSGTIILSDPGSPADAPADWLLSRGGGGGCGCWIEPDGDYTVAMDENDDGSSAAITIPFAFSLFGATYTTLYINNNGNVSFEDPYGTYTASGFPSDDYYMVAPFWADVDTRDSTDADTTDYLNGQVLYRVTDHALYVNWVAVGYYPEQDSLRNTFQLIITDGTDPVIPGGNNVSFCYQDMQWTTGNASGGVNGFGGFSATVGVNRGNGTDHAQVGRFAMDDASYGGAYADSSGVHWLDSTHFYLNTMNTGVPPIFGSDFDCDTVIVQMPEGNEVRDEEMYRLIVLPGAPDQLVNCTSVAPTLPNFVNINEGFAGHLELVFPIDATDAAIGLHYITFTATNDSPEPLSSTYVLQVEKQDLSTGSGTWGNGLYSLLPNPATADATLTWPHDLEVRGVSLLAMDGTQVTRFSPTAREQRLRLDLGGLPPGAYLVRVLTDQGPRTQRLLKISE